MKLKDSEVKRITNQAIKFVKSNPCCICSAESYCTTIYRYRGTCQIYRNLKAALFNVKEVADETT